MQANSEGQIKLKALKISAIAISSVVIVEITMGAIVNSLAIMSDGLHALLDALSSVMLFFAVRAALKPPDEEHTYGHEKFETIGGLIGGIVLIAVALLIFYEAAIRLITNTQIAGDVEYTGFIAIGYALFIASLRVTVFKKFEHVQSASMKAGFYDAISDFGSTIIALIGFGLALLGFAGADSFASIFLGVMLTYLSLKLARVSVMELSDSASKDLVEKCRKTILACEGVIKVENLKVRKVSSKIFVDAAVQVPNLMSLEESHSLASTVETCLKGALGNVDATIHIEPADKDRKMGKLVEKLAAAEGAKQVHEVLTNIVNGKQYITLHAYVSPEMSVEDAHKIAENIERRIRLEIKPLENVTVHIEPAGVAVSALKVSDDEVKKTVNDIAKDIHANMQVNRIVTYITEGTRYINIDCCFTKQTRLKEAHKTASWLEKETKDKFAGAKVTVHIEPAECTPK